MNELIKSLKDAEMYMIYIAPNCYASCEAIKAIRDAADAIERLKSGLRDWKKTLKRAKQNARLCKTRLKCSKSGL